MSLEAVDVERSGQRIRRVFNDPRLTASDRLADVVVAASLLLVLVSSQRIWDVGYSRPRMLMLFYVLVGASLLGRFWRRLPAPVAWAVASYAGFVIVGQVTWSRAVGWISADTVWQELRISVGLLLLAVSFGARGWVRWRWIIVSAGGFAAMAQLLLILSGRTFSTNAGEAGFYSHRPFGATFALLILAAFVILCSEPVRLSKPVTASAIFLGCSAVLAQHRSVWVSLGVVCTLMLVRSVRDRGYRTARIPVLVTMAFTCLAIILPVLTPLSLLPGGSSTGTGPAASVPASVTDSDSLGWRWDMWESRLRAARSLLEWLFGAVFGPTPVIGPEATVVNARFSAHNLWIDQTTMLGLVGLGLLLFLFWTGLRGTGRWPELQIFLWGLLAFCFFYNVMVWCYLLLGSAVALASTGSGLRTQGSSDNVDSSGDRGAVADQEQHQGL